MDERNTPEAISILIGSRLHAEARLSVFPGSIPPRQEAVVRQIHCAWLPDDEPILALYDDTLLGSGADGFALTTRRLLWRNFLGHPRQLRWTELDPATVVLEKEALRISGCRLPTLALKQVHALASLLQTLGSRHCGADRPRPMGAGIDAAALVKRARSWLGERAAVFYAPALPARKLRTARKIHAVSDDERVLVIIDDTLLGSAAQGVVLTDRRVCWRVLLAPPDSSPWGVIMHGAEPVIEPKLILHPSVIEPLTGLIRAVADELAARTTRVFCWGCRGEVWLDDGRCSGCGRLLAGQEGTRR